MLKASANFSDHTSKPGYFKSAENYRGKGAEARPK